MRANMTNGEAIEELALIVHKVTKRFGAIVALQDVSLHIQRGEIVGLVGDNGAGKSTLVKIISGIDQPTSGSILISGSRVSFGNPREARQAGVETVYQNLALCDNLDVAANFFLGREITVGGPFSWLRTRVMREQAREALDTVHIKIPGTMTGLVERMSGGQRQAIAIARAAFWRSKVLLLDEPTAALGVEESGEVMRVVRQMADDGLPMLFISHNMQQVHDMCDRIYVLRQGSQVAELSAAETDPQDIVGYITGAKS